MRLTLDRSSLREPIGATLRPSGGLRFSSCRPARARSSRLFTVLERKHDRGVDLFQIGEFEIDLLAVMENGGRRPGPLPPLGTSADRENVTTKSWVSAVHVVLGVSEYTT